jgi:DNA gyrase/topoisomerase IV subunit B
MHIRNLMITYFYRFFERLVHDGHLYVLETPLFRVRNKQRTLYCYDESERDAAIKELGGQPTGGAEGDTKDGQGRLREGPPGSSASGASARRRLEITRFKGLGEISPKEFAQFVGKDMRLSKVEYAPKPEAAPVFSFYMGKNTPERRDYIMDHLVVPVED